MNAVSGKIPLRQKQKTGNLAHPSPKSPTLTDGHSPRGYINKRLEWKPMLVSFFFIRILG
ncbi:hypothetical protein LEP1GSC185_3839 [Leptospira licerasiae serovar Varillal str. VAR 010]|uniref:Uncharacterized protein n=1 Tax=Leptospira licerasiae str. MMD4847 TaxID=1049971 RepID=A0ABN0HEJ0_9LEPT|nr:hypothetical protein LEP1GSC185_3839 [Leptospira licerasiae serovar Varillal str. VAR 010]EJZ44072.1 hypothetical protein LEP1GSC178_2052 [Leptospira licerasiae str. MMD4847]TGM88739.1 hypothetical protein EHR05_11040 [Leptospira licerasiae]